MTFYIIIIPPLLLSLIMILKLTKLKKHDEVLYRFCQLRREIMSYLRSKTTKIPKNDYEELRKLLSLLNSTIHNYDDHKEGFFRLDKILSNAKSTYSSVSEVKAKKNKNNQKVEYFYNEYGKILILAFLTYSPFLKSKIILFLLIHAANLLAIATGKYLDKSINKFIFFLKWLNNETNNFNIDPSNHSFNRFPK